MVSLENLKKGWYNLKKSGFFQTYDTYEAWVDATQPNEVERRKKIQEDLKQHGLRKELEEKQKFWEAVGGEGKHKL